MRRQKLKKSRSFRFSPGDLALLEALAKQDTDGNESMVLRKLIRKEAESRDIFFANSVSNTRQKDSTCETGAA
jgi:hypothetical protein